MQDFEHALVIILLVAGLAVVGRWLPWPQLITYILGGVGAALVPRFPRLALDPEFFFLCFLPPLIFSDGWLMPIRELMKAKRPILSLATGLVIFTTLGVGFVVHWLVPALPMAMAVALGAIVSPTDAVAVSAATEHLRVPARLTTILSGESLMNDATGLVAFKFALAAAAAAQISAGRMLGDFLYVALVGFGIGFLVSYGIGRLRDLLRFWRASDDVIETTLSLVTCYAAYLLAEQIDASGILAVVAAGLYSGWRDPIRMDVEARQTAYGVWNLLIFWLNGIAFVLLGLQFPAIFDAVRHDFSVPQLIGLTAAVSGAAMVARLIWVFPAGYGPFLIPKIRRSEPMPGWRGLLVVGWAGMRGTVTLAAALSIPFAMHEGVAFPGRNLVIFLAFGVIVTTLAVQGTTLEWLIRRLHIPEDESRPKEERLARMTAVEAGLTVLRALEAEASTPDQLAALGSVIAEYEARLALLTTEGETQASAQRRREAGAQFRLVALQAERQALNNLWISGAIIDDVHHPLQSLLDHEESLLTEDPPAGGATA